MSEAGVTKSLTPRQVLARAKPRYGLMARLLFRTLDIVYGKQTTVAKAAALELMARQPYEAWRHAAFVAVTHTGTTPEFALAVQRRANRATEQSNNETWHLLILHEMLHAQGHKPRLIRDRVIPQILSFISFHMALGLYVIRPAFSYRLNYWFEDHASRIYAQFCLDHPELYERPWTSVFAEEYGARESIGALFERVMIDEVEHADDSQALVEHARFGQ